MTNSNTAQTLKRTARRSAALLFLLACVFGCLLCGAIPALAELDSLDFQIEEELIQTDPPRVGGLLGQRYFELGYRLTEPNNRFSTSGQSSDLELKFNFPLFSHFDCKCSLTTTNSDAQITSPALFIGSGRVETDLSQAGGNYNEVSGNAFNALVIYNFRPGHSINPYFGGGLEFQSNDFVARYSASQHNDPLNGGAPRGPIARSFTWEENSELFLFETGVEFILSDQFSVQTQISTGQTFGTPNYNDLVKENLTGQLKSTYKFGKRFHLSSRVSTGFQKSPLGFTLLVGSSF